MNWNPWARSLVACVLLPLCAVSARADAPPHESPSAAARVWSVNDGALLSNTLREWALVSGWTVVWRLPESEDVRMPADTQYRGDFKRAVTELFNSLPQSARVHAEMRDDSAPPLLVVTRDQTGSGGRVRRLVASAFPPAAHPTPVAASVPAAAIPTPAVVALPVSLPAGTGPATGLAPTPPQAQPPAPFAPPAPAVQKWDVQIADVTYANTFRRWAGLAGYRIKWDASRNVLVDASGDLSGSFEDALTAVLSSPGIQESDYPLEVCFYPNKVARITRRGEQDKECK